MCLGTGDHTFLTLKYISFSNASYHFIYFLLVSHKYHCRNRFRCKLMLTSEQSLSTVPWEAFRSRGFSWLDLGGKSIPCSYNVKHFTLSRLSITAKPYKNTSTLQFENEISLLPRTHIQVSTLWYLRISNKFK